MNPDTEAQFKSVLDAFNLGLQSYESLRREVDRISDGDTNGLRVLVQEERKAAKKKQYSEEELTTAARERVRKIYGNYTLNVAAESPSPFLMLLIEKTMLIAKERQLAENPYTDWDAVKQENPEQLFYKIQPVLQMIADRYGDNLTLPKLLKLDEDLNRLLWEARGLPKDFDACLSKATAEATKHMRATTGEVYRQFESERYGFLTDETGAVVVDNPKKDADKQKLVVARPKSYELQRRLFPAMDTQPAGAQYFRWRTDELNQALQRANSKQEVIVAIESVTEALIFDSQFAMQPPALLLATRNHLDQFRKTLTDELSKRGSYDEKFMMRLNEEVEKFDLAYQSAMTARAWLFEASKGDYDHYHFKAFMETLPEDPSIYGTKTATQDAKIREKSEATFSEVMQARGIPKALAPEPFAPVLFERCLEVADSLLAKASDVAIAEARAGGQKPAYLKKALRDWSEVDKQDPGYIQKRQEKALELLRGAIALLPVDSEVGFTKDVHSHAAFAEMATAMGVTRTEPTSQEEPWETPRSFTAEGLHNAMEYLDRKLTKQRVH